jgi:hypothetical protein
LNLFHDLLTYTSPIVLIIGSSCGIYLLGSIDAKSKRILTYLLVSLGADVVSRIVLANSGNNLIVLPIYSVFELLIIASLYYHLGIKKALLIPLVALGAIYIIGEIIYIDSSNVKTFQSYAKIVSSFVIVLLALQFFIEKLKSENEISQSTRRLNSAILAYFALNLILLLPINLLINQIASSIIYIWYAYLGATVLFYSYLSVFIWKNGKTQKQLRCG